MGELTDLLQCPRCGKECRHWSDGSFNCEACGTQGILQLLKICPFCRKKANTDAYGFCLNCGQDRSDFDDFPETMQKIFEARSADIRTKGNLSEDYAAKYFQTKGYELRFISVWDESVHGRKLDNLAVKLLKSNQKKEAVLKIFKEQPMYRGVPDLVLRKDGKVSFTEVKTNEADLKPPQRYVLMKLKALGFEVSVTRVKVIDGKVFGILRIEPL